MELSYIVFESKDRGRLFLQSYSDLLKPYPNKIEEIKGFLSNIFKPCKDTYSASFWCDRGFAHWAFFIPRMGNGLTGLVVIFMLSRKNFFSLADWPLVLPFPSSDITLDEIRNYTVPDRLSIPKQNEKEGYRVRKEILSLFYKYFEEKEGIIILCKGYEKDFLALSFERIKIQERHKASFLIMKEPPVQHPFKIVISPSIDFIPQENRDTSHIIDLNTLNERDRYSHHTTHASFDITVRFAEHLYVLTSRRVNPDLKRELVRVLNHPNGADRLLFLLGATGFLKHPFLLTSLGPSFYLKHDEEILEGLSLIWPKLDIEERKEYFSYLYSLKATYPIKWATFLSAALFENFHSWTPLYDDSRIKKALLVTEYLHKNERNEEAWDFIITQFCSDDENNIFVFIQEYIAQINALNLEPRERLSGLLRIMSNCIRTDLRSCSKSITNHLIILLEDTFREIIWAKGELKDFYDSEIMQRTSISSSQYEQILLTALIKNVTLKFDDDREFFLGRLSRILPSTSLEFTNTETPLNAISLEASLQTPFLPEEVFGFNFLKLDDNEQKRLLPLLCNQIRLDTEIYLPTLITYSEEADLEALIIIEQYLAHPYLERIEIEKKILRKLSLSKRLSKKIRKGIKDILGK